MRKINYCSNANGIITIQSEKKNLVVVIEKALKNLERSGTPRRHTEYMPYPEEKTIADEEGGYFLNRIFESENGAGYYLKNIKEMPKLIEEYLEAFSKKAELLKNNEWAICYSYREYCTDTNHEFIREVTISNNHIAGKEIRNCKQCVCETTEYPYNWGNLCRFGGIDPEDIINTVVDALNFDETKNWAINRISDDSNIESLCEALDLTKAGLFNLYPKLAKVYRKIKKSKKEQT